MLFLGGTFIFESSFLANSYVPKFEPDACLPEKSYSPPPDLTEILCSFEPISIEDLVKVTTLAFSSYC